MDANEFTRNRWACRLESSGELVGFAVKPEGKTLDDIYEGTLVSRLYVRILQLSYQRIIINELAS